MNKFDERIQHILNDQTEQDAIEMKKEVWDGIEKELFEGSPIQPKKKKKLFPVIGAAAAAIALLISVETETGSAFMNNIKDLFAPEKEIIQSIEGQEEPTNVQLHEGKEAEYVIYIDESRYKMIIGENSDLITTIDPLPEKYPEVSLEIKQYPTVPPEALADDLQSSLKPEFPNLRDVETVTEPVEGYHLHGLTESTWDGNVIDLYIVSNGKGGSFALTSKYFLEAAEGHGARFYHMLESFEVIE
ncbi:hypothetical protein ACFQ38_13490 [Sporosarcina contaminans]|uniref:DUF4367 domain-containing protein n=1 Tax=Sporosarcina contaminans TaxID=633403 RepID=A0ABW3TZ53_9BACL